MSWIGQSDASHVANTPSDQHVTWKRDTALERDGAEPCSDEWDGAAESTRYDGARRGPRRTIAMAYPAASNPTINQTSGWGVHFGKSTANGMARQILRNAWRVSSTTKYRPMAEIEP